MNVDARRATVALVIVLVASAGIAAGATRLVAAPTTLAATARPPPIVFQAGASTFSTYYVPSFSLSANASSFGASVVGVPAGTVVVGELARLVHQRGVASTITVTAPTVANARVTALTLEFLDGATVVGTLDLKAASPSATMAGVAAGKTLVVRATVSLADGTGQNHLGAPTPLTVQAR